MTTLEQTITRNLLRYAAGHQIFCRCGSILDARRTVLFELKKGGEVLKTYTCCARCFDIARPELEAIATRTGTAFEVTDGREVFAPPKRSAAPKAAAKQPTGKVRKVKGGFFVTQTVDPLTGEPIS